MTAIKLIAATTLAFTLLTLGMASTAHANTAEQNQKLEQSFEVECTSATYGNDGKCWVKGTQTGEQSQKIALRKGLKAHKPVDTALDGITLLAAGALVTTGVSAVLLKNRIK